MNRPKGPKFVSDCPEEKVKPTIQKKAGRSVWANITRATRKRTHCDRCNNPLTGKQERFCSDNCRWALRNKARYEKQKLAVMLAYRVEELIPTISRLAKEILELHEVKRKER